MIETTKGPIVILTGAGISAESGVQTFRDQGGLWEGHRIDDVATPEAFLKNPNMVQKFYNDRRAQLLSPKIMPNPAHLALAALEKKYPDQVYIVTQNIDHLHEMAGSKNVIHMHGSLFEVRCTQTEKVYMNWQAPVDAKTLCPCCEKTGTLRPNIVWFGEMPFELERIFELLDECTHFMSIGTSGQVYPAAGFAEHVRMKGKAKTAELNLEPSAISHIFAEKIYGPAGTIVPKYLDQFLIG